MLSTVRKSRPLILMTCHSTAASSGLTRKQPPIAHKMRRRKFIIRKRLQDECHPFRRTSAHLTLACAFLSNSYGSCFPCPLSCFNTNRIFVDLRAVFCRQEIGAGGGLPLDNSRIFAFRAECRASRGFYKTFRPRQHVFGRCHVRDLRRSIQPTDHVPSVYLPP